DGVLPCPIQSESGLRYERLPYPFATREAFLDHQPIRLGALNGPEEVASDVREAEARASGQGEARAEAGAQEGGQAREGARRASRRPGRGRGRRGAARAVGRRARGQRAADDGLTKRRARPAPPTGAPWRCAAAPPV